MAGSSVLRRCETCSHDQSIHDPHQRPLLASLPKEATEPHAWEAFRMTAFDGLSGADAVSPSPISEHTP
jgi:hypothetical protein